MLWTCLYVSVKKKTNFESFSVSQNLVVFQKKHKKRQIFPTFFFDPTLFSAGNRQTAEKITSAIPNDQNVGQKNFHDILIRIGGRNPKCYTPPFKAQWGWNEHLKPILTWHENLASSKYLGVSWDKQNKKWKASFNYNKKKVHIGFFTNQNDAAKAVNWKCKELKIPIKNPEVVGVLDDEQLKQKVMTFLSFLCYCIYFWTREDTL